jgi:phage/plasmid primase-like uncharacterized protein
MKADYVKAVAKGRWDLILSSLAPQLQAALENHRKHVPCPVHGGKDGFRVFKDVQLTGATICNTCGPHTDGFATLMWANGWDFATALKAVAGYLSMPQKYAALPQIKIPPPPQRAATVTDEAAIEKARNSLNDVWAASIGCYEREAEPARLYLARRGISIHIPDEIRFHPKLPYFDGKNKLGNFPALVTMVSDVNDVPVTIHRTYLTLDGKKADVGSPKKLMAYPANRKIIGGSIRLQAKQRSEVLLIAEGLETSLAVMEATGLPVWCAVNAHILENFVAPAWVNQVFVFADKDRPTTQHPKGHGQEAARHLVQRIWAQGIKCSAIVPAGEIQDGQKSLDWLDVLNQKGKSGFPSLMALSRAVKLAA